MGKDQQEMAQQLQQVSSGSIRNGGGGGLGVILTGCRSRPVLLVNPSALAALYLPLNAQFIAIVQVTVYAAYCGALLVRSDAAAPADRSWRTGSTGARSWWSALLCYC
jgi:hypothetical protein